MNITFGSSSSNFNKVVTGSVFVSEQPVFKSYSGMTNLITGTSHTMTAAEALDGVYRRTTLDALTDTFPSASSIVSELNSIQGTVAVGDSFELHVVRSAGPNNTNLTFSNGTGITFYGRNQFKGLRSSTIQFVVTNIGSGTETVDIYALHANH